MSKTGMWGAIALIVVLAIGGLWYATQQQSLSAPVAQENTQTQAQPMNTQNSVQQPATANTPPASSISASDTSDASLQSDLQTIDGHMQAASESSAAASSFSDTPVAQTE